LANLLSNAELGRYQLIFPVFMLCMAVSSSGIQTALSKMVSALHASGRKKEIRITTIMAMGWSLGLALTGSVILVLGADWIAVHVLKESACGPYLRILALALPFASLHSCITGYFYGRRQTTVPAAAQLLEQIARVGCIYILSIRIYGAHPVDASIAVYGLVAGEAVSCLVTCICYQADIHKNRNSSNAEKIPKRRLAAKLWQYAGWLTVNRVSVTMLQSVEMVLMPLMLTRYYTDSVAALEVFGVMTGIVIPMLSFPTTLTNALSTMLLPTISEADAAHNYRTIASTFEKSLQSCLLLGIFVSMLFAAFGSEIGEVLFQDASAGRLIGRFAVVCPLMYLHSLFASTLNGCGKMNETLMHHVIGSAIRIAGIILLMPKMGLYGYLIGLLMANIVVTMIASVRLHQLADVHFHACRDILLPSCAAVTGAVIARCMHVPEIKIFLPGGSLLWELVEKCSMMGIVFILFMSGSFVAVRFKKR
jgi:stage V sporulation protein B